MLPLAELTLPSADEEIWRYSRIDQLDIASFAPSEPLTAIESIDQRVAVSSGPAGGEQMLDEFARYNTAGQSTRTIAVPRNAAVEAPIIVDHCASAGTACFPRTVIEVGDGAQCTIIERFRSEAGAAPSLTVPMLILDVGNGASVTYLAINDVSLDSWQVGHQFITAHRDSTVNLSTVTLGGYYTRVRTESRSAEPGSTMRQVALYFAAGDQMHDFRVHQDHDAPHTSSDLLFKGAVQDRARSVYTGLISIREHAKGTSANQTNRNLTLSEGAWAESVPNLDIRNNDVRCSHASTVGPIDAEQRFYLESRGVPPETAERLVVLGFFEEVLTQLPGGAVTDELRARVSDRLSIGGAGQ